MEFNYAYKGNTSVGDRGSSTQMSFSPDTKRPPTYFIGELYQNVAFREAISALHKVVVSDLRYQPKDKSKYKEWRDRQDDIDWVKAGAMRQEVASKIQSLEEKLLQLNQRRYNRLEPYYRAVK